MYLVKLHPPSANHRADTLRLSKTPNPCYPSELSDPKSLHLGGKQHHLDGKHPTQLPTPQDAPCPHLPQGDSLMGLTLSSPLGGLSPFPNRVPELLMCNSVL